MTLLPTVANIESLITALPALTKRKDAIKTKIIFFNLVTGIKQVYLLH